MNDEQARASHPSSAHDSGAFWRIVNAERDRVWAQAAAAPPPSRWERLMGRLKLYARRWGNS